MVPGVHHERSLHVNWLASLEAISYSTCGAIHAEHDPNDSVAFLHHDASHPVFWPGRQLLLTFGWFLHLWTSWPPLVAVSSAGEVSCSPGFYFNGIGLPFRWQTSPFKSGHALLSVTDYHELVWPLLPLSPPLVCFIAFSLFQPWLQTMDGLIPLLTFWKGFYHHLQTVDSTTLMFWLIVLLDWRQSAANHPLNSSRTYLP